MLPSLDLNVPSVRMVAVAFGEKKIGGGLVPLHDLCSVGRTPRQQNIGYRQGSLPGETRLLKKIEASHLCMGIYMHECPARFIFFINMLTKQV